MPARPILPWTVQPYVPAAPNIALFGGGPKEDWNPYTRAKLLTATGAPVIKAAPNGSGWNFPTTSDYYSKAQLLTRGTGAGNELFRNFFELIVFTCTSNAAVQAVYSEGATSTDSGGGTPRIILQNNAGTLRFYNGSAYTTIESTVLGKRYVFARTYTDASPYTTQYWLNGRLILSEAAYRSGNTYSTYIGAGFGGAFSNGVVHEYFCTQAASARVDQTFSRNVTDNPWLIYAPVNRKYRRQPAAAAGGARGLFLPPHLTGLGSGGSFFGDRL